MMTRSVLVSHVKFDDGLLDRKLVDIKNVLQGDEMQVAMRRTAADIDSLWERTIYQYFDSTKTMQVTSVDKMVRHLGGNDPKGEWKPTERYFTRSTSGLLGKACHVTVGASGRISVRMKKLVQSTSVKQKWQGADYGEFLRKGIGPSMGAYDPPSGKRMILSDDDNTVWWACGYHPGFTNRRWKRFVGEFKEQYKEIVRKNMTGVVRKVMAG